MVAKSERLIILSEAEQFALYGLPDFDDGQQMQYLSFTNQELELVFSRSNIHAQVHCALQIGYFKAKHAFFQFYREETEEDRVFILTHYFNSQVLVPQSVTKHEYYKQHHLIATLCGYRLWSGEFLPQLEKQVAQNVHRDVSPGFIVAELLSYLNEQKIVRPGYTTLQTIIGEALSTERKRLCKLLADMLDESTKNALQQLLIRNDSLSGFAILKQDAKHFGYRQMVLERQKRATLEPLYLITKTLLPKLAISHQNLNYYASLANFYTIYDLRRLRSEQTYLYLLCYAWQRYRQFTDNLVDAMGYHMKKIEDETKARANKQYLLEQVKLQQEAVQIGRLLLLYVDDEVVNTIPFGIVREHAFRIMPKDTLQIIGQRLSTKQASKLALHWQFVDELSQRVRQHLRPLYTALDFSSAKPDNPWIMALAWMRSLFAKKQQLSKRPLTECPEGVVPKRLRPYLMKFDETGNVVGLNANCYEFWIYRQLRKRLKSGEIYLDDSMQHRCFTDDLVSLKEKATALSQLDIPWLQQPIEVQLEALTAELQDQWMAFDSELRKGKLKHLEYDKQKKTLLWHRPKANNNATQQDTFYDKLGFCDIADVFRFVNKQCQFMTAMTPLQPRYTKQIPDEDSLMAVIIAQAMNHGNFTLAQASDIPYHILNTMYQQHLRLATLQAANDRISNAVAELPIFPHYSFDLGVLHGSVDGQKFEVEHPTVKARYSRKYFGRGKGVVAYTLLCNHVPIQGWLIGAHEFEGHHVFDVWYNNTSNIVPTVITGDMHSINKANFAILHWFGLPFEPRFTNLQVQLKELHCVGDPAQYEKYLIRPTSEIDLQAIINEKTNIDQIVATLGLKEMTQSTLIRKLCTYTQSNPTHRAIFYFDKLIRSIYTLRYLRDPQLQRNVHRSQNRVESYHQLRSAIAKVGGKKILTGRTDIEIEISNQCARLIANVIIYYNSAILSRLLAKYETNPKILELIKKISPVAWRHTYLNGHYTFRSSKQIIALDAMVAELALE
jgi:TnpA family transposase